MHIWHVNQQWPALEPALLTLGSFDGLHRGHQRLLGQLSTSAQQKGLKSVALTFDPHPRQLLSKKSEAHSIAPLEWVKKLWEQQGVDHLIVKKVDPIFLQTTASDFLASLLQHIPLKGFVVGYDVGFGVGREGNSEFLKKYCEDRQLYFQQAPALTDNGEIISSRSVRQLIKDKNFEKLESFLNRKYFIQGPVIRGAQLGRKLGFPTANVQLPNDLCLPLGVFAGQCFVDGEWHWGAANIGFRPSVGQEHHLQFEVHILDFNKEIYGKVLRFEFDHSLREEKKFLGLDELKEQIHKDVENLRRWSSYKKRHSNII